MRLGCCVGLDQVSILSDVGFDFIELPLVSIMEKSDSEFLSLVDDVKRWKVKPQVCNIFFPASIRLTGYDADLEKTLEYVKIALYRASQLGVDTIVFGSAGAKNVPSGFNKQNAYEQLRELLKRVSLIAKEYNINIVVEPLNKMESNIITNTSEGLILVQDVDCLNVRLLVDFYHFSVGQESISGLKEALPFVKHLHIARPLGRAFPILEEDEYFVFFKEFIKFGYSGRISIEGNTKDLKTDSDKSLKVLKKIIMECERNL